MEETLKQESIECASKTRSGKVQPKPKKGTEEKWDQRLGRKIGECITEESLECQDEEFVYYSSDNGEPLRIFSQGLRFREMTGSYF